MDKLYIIGNGFDLHHGLPTSYSGFRSYLRQHNPTLLDTLSNAFSYPSSDKDIWGRFEENLSFIDLDYFDEIICSYIPSLSSDDYLKDMAACHREAETIVFNVTEGLRYEFSNYIEHASTCRVDPNRLLDLDLTAFYLSFNYTRTLEEHYGVHGSKILYIHGRYDDQENIVLGHAISPDSFVQERENQSPPEHYNTEEIREWHDDMSNQHVPFLDEARDELASYYGRSYKNSVSIINENAEFFARLNTVRSIFVLGHSLSDVDLTYFEAIKDSVPKSCHWTVSYYSESEKSDLEDQLLGLNIRFENFDLIKLCTLEIQQ